MLLALFKYSDFMYGFNTLYIGNFNKRFHHFVNNFTFFDEGLIISGYKS